MEINTVEDLDMALASGPYAWPGGYPLYFVTADGEALSFATVQAEVALVKGAVEQQDNTGGWRVIGMDVNWEDTELYCAHSGGRIEPAYADDN